MHHSQLGLAKMSKNKAVVSEIDKAVALEEDLSDSEVFSGALHGPDAGAHFVEDCETGVLA